MACRESLSEPFVGFQFWLPSLLVLSAVCRTLVERFSDQLGMGRAGHGCCQGPVGGLVGLPCRIFGWQETLSKDVSYESLVGGLFLEENDVGTCRGLVGPLVLVIYFPAQHSLLAN